MHFNWSKTFGPHGNASQQLFDYYSGVYESAPEQREREEMAKAKCLAEWQSDLEQGTQPLHISVEILRDTIKKLKPGKGSFDGVTAEVLRELDEENLAAMTTALSHLFQQTSMPQSSKTSDLSQRWSLSESWWDTRSCTLSQHHHCKHSSADSSQAVTHPKQSSA